VIREHYGQIEAFFVELIRQGQQSGGFDSQSPPHVHAWHLINLGIGYAMISLNIPQFETFAGVAAIESVVRGLKA
jgi:hypothetical protein